MITTLEDLAWSQKKLRRADNEHEKARKALKATRDEQLATLRRTGITKLELASAMGVSVPHVGVLLRRMGVE